MSQRSPVVYLVDDDRAVLDSLQLLMRSVGLPSRPFVSAQAFLDVFDPDQPGCLVLDVRMPGMSGLDLQQALHERGASIPIVFVTAHGDVPMAVEAIKAGAVDFVQKPFRDQELIDKVQDALAHDAERRAASGARQVALDRIADLTPREREVMDLVVEGKANKVIAGDLGISQRTVEIHRARVMEKMRVSSVAELVQIVLRAQEDGSP